MSADGLLLVELRAACADSIRLGECGPEIFEKAEGVLQRTDCSAGLRKVAALFLHKTGKGKRDYLHLAVAIDSDSTDFLLKVIRIWLKERIHKNIGSTDNEFLFYSSLILRVSKVKNEVKINLSSREFSELRRSLLVTALIISEIREENCTQLFKATAKMFDSEEDIEEVIQFCSTELPLDMAGNLLLVTILCAGKDISELHLSHWLSEMKSWSAEQELASASSPLICLLISSASRLPSVVGIFVDCLLSPTSAIRVNTLRCWLGRVVSVPAGISVLEAVLVELINRWNCVEEEKRCQFWPPLNFEAEDASCVDPLWNWAESDGVTWIEDRILESYLKVWEIISHKNKARKPQADDKMVLLALRWHDEEIRHAAFNLILTMDCTNTLQEEFLLANNNAINDNLRKVIRRCGSRFILSQKSADTSKLLEANELCYEKEDDERVFLPDSEKIPPLPEGAHLDFFVNKLLVDGGSPASNHVPAFPELYDRLDKLGMHHRVYAKLLTEAMNKNFITGSAGFEAKSDFAWNVISRCRMKAVVDGGCTNLEELISIERPLAQKFFSKASALLFDPSCSVRTLVLSRILWSCCENESSLFVSLWTLIQENLLPSTDPSVLTRVLKTTKLFLSKAECNFPSEFVPVLFFFCLNAQEYPDFLTRSSSIIVFGFLLKRITDARQEFLFKFIGHYPDLWIKVQPQLYSLSSLPRQQRVLLLTFLSRFAIGHPCFYVISDLISLSKLLEQLEIIRITSPDVRERRFCIDVLMQLTPRHQHELLARKMLESVKSLNTEADYSYLDDRLYPSYEEPSTMPKVVVLSEYYKRIDGISTCSNAINALAKLKNDTDLENEHSAQVYCLALTRMAQILKENGSPDEVVSLCREASSLVQHPFPRVRSLVSRIPVVLGRTALFSHGKYLCEFLSC